MTTQRAYQFGGNSNNPLQGLMGIVIAILFFVGLFMFMNFLFTLLWKVLPIILIATAIIDHKVILSYAGWIGRLFKSNWITGLVAALLTGLGAPVVGIFLLGKALLKKKVKGIQDDIQRKQEDEFVAYEEVDNKPLELPELEAPKQEKGNTGYDEMFK